MEKESIISRKGLTENEQKIEEYFVNHAYLYEQEHMETYKNFPASIEGRYICSDLFKETFDVYTTSTETRRKYNYLVHNSAAVLANDLFEETVTNNTITDCIFLTGMPGAGKSFFIQSLNLEHQIPEQIMIYEGSIITNTIIEKILKALANNKNIHIIVIKPTLELAYQNVLTRIKESGRGASLETMAQIASGLYEAVKKLYAIFKDRIEIGIYAKNQNDEIEIYEGISYIELLNIGTYEEVLEELRAIRARDNNEIKR